VFASSTLLFLIGLLLSPSKYGPTLNKSIVVPGFTLRLRSHLLFLSFACPIVFPYSWGSCAMVAIFVVLWFLPIRIERPESEIRPSLALALLSMVMVCMLLNGALGLLEGRGFLTFIKLVGVSTLILTQVTMLIVIYRGAIIERETLKTPKVTIPLAPAVIYILGFSIVFLSPLWFIPLAASLLVSIALLPEVITLPSLEFKSYALTAALSFGVPLFFNGYEVALVGGLVILAFKFLALVEMRGHVTRSKETFLKGELGRLPYEGREPTSLLEAYSNLGLLFPLAQWSRYVGELTDGFRINCEFLFKGGYLIYRRI